MKKARERNNQNANEKKLELGLKTLTIVNLRNLIKSTKEKHSKQNLDCLLKKLLLK